MKKLSYKLIIFLCLQAFLIAGCLLLGSLVLSYWLPNDRLSTIHDNQRLLLNAPQPRLIFVGGSALDYSLNSALLASQSDCSVINMGIQGSIGLRFMLEQIKPHILRGDTVVITPELAHYYQLDINGESTLYRLLLRYPQGIKWLNSEQLLNAYRHIPSVFGQTLIDIRTQAGLKLLGAPGFRAKNNQYGDYVGHASKPSLYKPSSAIPQPQQLQEQTFVLLDEFQTLTKLRNARLIVAHAPISESANDSEQQARVLTQLSKYELNVLGKPGDYVFPDAHFFDTQHHLQYDQRNRYTTQLMRDLQSKGSLCNFP